MVKILDDWWLLKRVNSGLSRIRRSVRFSKLDRVVKLLCREIHKVVNLR
jgi:hypothetical protein